MRWLRAFPVVLATALTGCEDTTGAGDVLVTLQIDHSTIAASDSTHVRINVTNTSGRKITIAANTCPRTFRIFNRLGHEVAPDLGYCPLSLEFRNLDVGQTHTFDYLWRPVDPVSGNPLERGSYFIVGYSGAEGRRYESERVTVRIN